MTTILSQKILRPSHFIIYKNYISRLHFNATNITGFLKGTTYWDGNLNVYTISQWDNINSWNNWESSEERMIIINEFQDLIIKESHDEIFKVMKTNNLFLL